MEDINWNKKLRIKLLKTALFDCAIDEKCCSVDEGRGICPLFSSPPQEIWQLKSPHPWEFTIQCKKMLMPWAQPGGGVEWAQLELTDALIYYGGVPYTFKKVLHLT